MRSMDTKEIFILYLEMSYIDVGYRSDSCMLIIFSGYLNETISWLISLVTCMFTIFSIASSIDLCVLNVRSFR